MKCWAKIVKQDSLRRVVPTVALLALTSVSSLPQETTLRSQSNVVLVPTLVKDAGGEYEMFETRKKFEVRMNDFANHLHSRYLLSITPKNPHPGLHQIRVRLRDAGSDVVLARSSYWAEGTR